MTETHFDPPSAASPGLGGLGRIAAALGRLWAGIRDAFAEVDADLVDINAPRRPNPDSPFAAPPLRLVRPQGQSRRPAPGSRTPAESVAPGRDPALVGADRREEVESLR